MLEFIEDTHKYILDGEEIPCVSEITRFVQRELYKDSDPCAMEVAADRGTRVHRACEEIDRTGTVECDPNISGYVRAYTKFLSEHDVKWELIEYSFWNAIPVFDRKNGISEFKYAGTLDRYGTVDGSPALLDIKTTKRISSKHKVQYGAQLEAYRYGINLNYYDTKLLVLQLAEDGNYKLIDLAENDGINNAVFNSCVQLHYTLQTKKRKKKNVCADTGD